MSSLSLADLPQEIYYLIFIYLKKVHVAYAFLKLNNRLSLAAQYFIGNQLDLTKIHDNFLFQYSLFTLLPSIGSNLRHLSIGDPYPLSSYIEQIKRFCLNLETLVIYCCGSVDDIRCYATGFIHRQLISLTLIYNGNIVGEQLAARLLDKDDEDEETRTMPLALCLTLHLSSIDDLVLLKRYAESSYLPDGLYMIECISNGEWLTDDKDDLCTVSKGLPREGIFSIKQSDIDRYCREYELRNELSQRLLTVQICHADEEYWPTSSMLSTRRRPSTYSTPTFTFERIDNSEQFYIRPCYPRARRLQVAGQRIIVSMREDQSTSAHRFRLHRIS